MTLTEQGIGVLLLFSMLGCGLIGGVFFAFSTFVMKALHRLPAHEGIAAMQSINIVVLNPWFLGAFFATGGACALLTILVLSTRHGVEAVPLVLASALYLIGTLGVTLTCNVPRNQKLARLDPHSSDAVAYWHDYVSNWTRWNHMRTIAALAAMVLFGMVLAYWPG